jgi:hypothetical protein
MLRTESGWQASGERPHSASRLDRALWHRIISPMRMAVDSAGSLIAIKIAWWPGRIRKRLASIQPGRSPFYAKEYQTLGRNSTPELLRNVRLHHKSRGGDYAEVIAYRTGEIY